MTPLSWTTLEFEEKERHPDWIWYTGLIFGIGAVLAFFYHNVFFGIFLVVAGISVILFAIRAPRLLHISINEKDIVIDGERIAYERVNQFWIDESAKPDKLLLLVKGSFVPMLSIPLHDVTAERVRSELAKHTPEVQMQESVGTLLFDRLGF